ncbi:hypothetical protein BC830DRAFT_1052101, partial [Chytriomyces sp. MP71]
VQPLGNALLAATHPHNAPFANRTAGLGLFAALDDAALLYLVVGNLTFFDDASVLTLIQCSRAFYVLANAEEVWRARTIARFGGALGTFRDSWKNTFKACLAGDRMPADAPIKVGLYSDFLFGSWRCSTVPLDILCRADAKETIDRRSGLSLADFVREYDEPGKPVILTDIVTQWPAYHKWSMGHLESTLGDTVFRAEAIDCTFKTYAEYARVNRAHEDAFEEAPLYLFDKFFSKRTQLAGDYTVPEYFSQDLFRLLGEDARPDYRWIIIGPARSGSTFHLDPNSTSAWNAVITGSKKWILFPPDCVPPGVFPSADGSEVTTPISLAEWFMNHYDEMESWPVKPIECVCRAGEVIYVPRGWWHCVMNLEESIAITQNFVN